MVNATSEPFHIPAPVNGINSVTALANLDPTYCIYSYNFVPGAYGLLVRKGYADYVTNITGTGGVRTLVPVKAISAANNRLWAISADGIWLATASTSSPTKTVTFGHLV
jgi:hypothetical protein